MSATATMSEQAERLLSRLDELGVPSRLVDEIVAPQIIRYEITPANDQIKMRDYRKLDRASDLAYCLEAQSVAIIAPVPGRSVVAIEVARKDREYVALSDLPRAHVPLLLNLGVEIDGKPAILPLQDAPHMLCAGQTGAGKTNLLHVMLAQLIDSHTPEQLQLVLIDPKRVEFAAYEDAPHLAAPVADTPQEAIRQLRGVVLTMERRYETLRALGARNITEANEILEAGGHDQIPFAVVFVDEIADLMMTSAKETESLLVRIAQKGRASGIHLVLATQYPLREIYTGLLRVNVATRVAFAVPDATASRVILDMGGAESLLGQGDGLLSICGLPPRRFQAAACTQQDIREIIERRTP